MHNYENERALKESRFMSPPFGSKALMVRPIRKCGRFNRKCRTWAATARGNQLGDEAMKHAEIDYRRLAILRQRQPSAPSGKPRRI